MDTHILADDHLGRVIPGGHGYGIVEEPVARPASGTL